MPRKNKPEPWEGGSSDEWEPEENPDAPEVMPSYDDKGAKKEGETVSKTSSVQDENQASRKRGRRDKKKNNKIEEIDKPRGVERGLQPEKILAAQLYNSSVFFLVKWQDCLDLDVVPGKDLNQHYPEFVIQYYESCVPFSVRHKIGRVPRIAPELLPEELEVPKEPEVPAMPDIPMDVSDNLIPPEMPSREPPAEQPLSDMHMPEMPEMPPMPPMQPMQMPDMQMPPMQMPDMQMPPMQMPDMSMPHMQMPQMSMPDMSMPDMSAQPETPMDVPVN